ncbi:hypothetical protein GGH93_006207 [Coemansia aciculifera]|nr:hypothetical protein GGH93_006207 [Coemansia aciculifera]
MTDSPPSPIVPAPGSTASASTTVSIATNFGGNSVRRFDRTPTNSRRVRVATAHTQTATAAAAAKTTRQSDRHHLATDTSTTTPTHSAKSKAQFTFRAASTAFPSLQDPPPQLQLQPASQRREFVGAALLPSLSRRATISEQKHGPLRTGLRPMLDRNASVASRATAASSSSSHSEAGAYTGTPSVQHQQRQASLSIDQMSVDSAQATLTPTSRGSYETPNDNENDGLYASEFWLTALVPKPHTNFFGYESSIGPICISISTRESHECYKALVRTPFKFGVVYVPTMVIDEPIFGTDLDRLSSPTPQKILLYHALRLYFQQADDERRGYLLTALRNRQLVQETANGISFVKPTATCVPDALWGRTVADAIKDVTVAPGSISGSADCPPRRKRGLQRSNTKRSIELRRAEINDFIDSIFQPTSTNPDPDPAPKQSPLALRPASFDGDCDDGCSEDGDDSSILADIHSFLAAERDLRDLAVATESLTEIRDDHLKPLLRNLEPKLFRRRLRVDFVVVGAADHSQLVDNAAPHRRFLRTLERASARMRGDSGSAADSLRPGEDSLPEQHWVSAKGNVARPSDKALRLQQAVAAAAASRRQKTREEMEEKRNNVIQELIATERSYVEKMRALIDIYAVPLRSAARSANNALIPAYDAHVVFGNIERVSEVNERFLGDLEAWSRGEMDPKETIGSLCRDHFVDFHVYKRYINGYQHALVMSRELEAKNPLYAAFLQRAREREECRKLGISDLLIMPVQRIPRYTLLLSDLIKLIPEDDPDVPRIQLALERVNEIGQLADNQVAESVAELHHIHTTIEGCPPNLISASREFIGAIDASEIDLATGAPKKPMCLLVFSDLLMIVERFWPPRDHGGIRVTGKATSRQQCPIHAMSPSDTTKMAASGSLSSGLNAASMGSGASPMISSAVPASVSLSTGPMAKQPAACTCGSGYSSPAANAFLSTSSGGSSRKRWGRFAGWIDITRVSILEKNMSPSSRSFFIHRYPGGAEDLQASATDVSLVRRQRTATTTPSANPKSLKSSGSSIISLDSSNTSSPLPAGDSQAQLRATGGRLASDQVHQEFARILYPNETTYESYGDHGYWYPQSLHEFDTDHPLSRDAFFEFLNTAWERSVARCFEASSSSATGLSRHGSNSGSGTSAFSPRARADTGGGGSTDSTHRRTKSGVEDFSPATSLVHPELDRVDVGGQSWTVRIWDSADYTRSRHNCPSALAADMTVVWDYRQMGSPSQLIALDDNRRGRAEQSSFEPGRTAFYPHQACRVMDFGDDYFHVTSTVLPLDAQQPSAASDTFAELVEEREVADSWPALCRLVEQAITMYQYVLLAYPEHRRVQQCYNRSILASLFGQNALGSSTSAKTEAASATPRKLFSRAKHLFSSGKQRGSSSFKESPDAANLFSSAYSNAVAVDTIGPSSGSSPYNHSTISTPLSVLGKYKLKTKSSTMVSSRRVHVVQQQGSATSSPAKAASAMSSPGQPLVAPAGKAALTPASFDASDEFLFSTSDTVGKELSSSIANSRKRFDAFSTARADNVQLSGRKVSHTIDDFPSLAPGSGSEQVELRIRSQTSWEHRGRSVSSMLSVQSSSPGLASSAGQLPRPSVSPSPNGPANFVSPSLCGLSPMLSVRDDRAPSMRLVESDAYIKRRSMSVVSAASVSSARTGQDVFSQRLRPAASTVSSRDGGLRRQGKDADDEFSIRLDLQSHSECLDIPSDLRLEFDEALGTANSTPPHPAAGLAILDMQAFSSPFAAPVISSRPTNRVGNTGLNVLIPPTGSNLDPRNTWDARSPDRDDVAGQRVQLPLSSADSAVSVLSAQSTSSKAGATSRGPNRRQAVYGPPLHSPTVTTEHTAGPPREAAKPHLVLSESDILLDIARELGQDEPFGILAANSPIYVDDDEIASHLNQMSVLQRSQTSPMFSQFDAMSSSMPDSGANTLISRDSLRPLPLPPLPPHTKSLNLGSDRQKAPAPQASVSKAAAGSSIYASAWAQGDRPRIPQPPPMKYNLQQQQQATSQPASTSADYRRLPNLPPRVRSTVASVYLDKGSTHSNPAPSAERSRHLSSHPPN